MRVAYDSRPAAENSGIGRYARSLLAALTTTAPPGDEVLESHHARDADVYHAPWLGGAPLRPHVPAVVTVHDLHALTRPGERLRGGLRAHWRHLAAQRATRIIVPTAAVGTAAERTLGIDPPHIVAIAEAAAPVFWPRPASAVDAAREQLGLPDDYLLWVGSMRIPDPRKRVASLARAAGRRLPLVLVGPAARWVRELPDVIVCGELSDDLLAAVYTGARALVFPSDEEGFALAPLEALACGTPVAACAAPGVAEVLGSRAALVEAGDLGGLVAAAESASRPAPAPPAWTWEDAARATWEVYAEAAEIPPRFRGARRGPRGSEGPGSGSPSGGADA